MLNGEAAHGRRPTAIEVNGLQPNLGETYGRTAIIRSIFAIAIAALVLAWPTLVNRGPFFISDTTGYIRSADAAISTLLSYDSIWSNKKDQYKKWPEREEREMAAPSAAPLHPPLIGRSVYYGTLIYLPVVLGSEEFGVLVQTLLAALLIWLAIIPLRLRSRGRREMAFAIAILLLAVTSSLPFTASLLVPDYLSGLACAALVLLLWFWDDFTRLQAGMLAAIIGLAALSHSSNLPLLLALSLAGLAARRVALISWKAAGIGLAAVVLGLGGEALFVLAVQSQTGYTPIRPPFLTARLVADGPGTHLVRSTCPDAAWEVCRYASKIPRDSDLFLWSEDSDGVFSNADFRSQQRLSEQDTAFAIATFRAAPKWTITTTGEAFLRQLSLMDLGIWQHQRFSLENLPAPVAARMAKTRSAEGEMPIEPFASIITVAFLGAVGLALFLLWTSRRSPHPRTRAFAGALIFVLLAILLNAAITGGLSKPDARYNLRIIWLFPLFTYLLAVACRWLLREAVTQPS